MIRRYTLSKMGAVWTDEARYGNWLEIEKVACEALAELGLIPELDARSIRKKGSFSVSRIEELEATTHHDVAAFVQSVAETLGEEGRWVHFGLTSSDLLDTGLALQLRQATSLILEKLVDLMRLLREKAFDYQYTPMAGRTHGVFAEPITFGHKLAIWVFELERANRRLRKAQETVSVGKVSGVVGTYSQVDPKVEEIVCQRLGLSTPEATNQVLQRDRHAEYMAALALAAASLEKFATEIRHLSRTEIREAEEPFTPGQKGSSAMPHKRNPILCERICGLARLIRANLSVALENVALWHERDISHSSAERVILPDSTSALDYMLHLFIRVVKGMNVSPDRMKHNLNIYDGVIYSQSVLSGLVRKGMSREEAYRLVQETAITALDNPNNEEAEFKEALKADTRVKRFLSEGELEALFRPDFHLRHLHRIFDPLEKLEFDSPSN